MPRTSVLVCGTAALVVAMSACSSPDAGDTVTVFAAALRAGGAFPDVGRGRVLYVGIDVGEQQERLRRLADGARAAANRAGAPVDGARLHPHVTLARSGRPVEMSRWVRLLDTYAGPSWPVNRLTLFASHLGEGPRRRPRHEVVASVPLGPG